MNLHRLRIFVITLLIASSTHCQYLKPSLPVAVTYRSSMVGQGYVAQFHNTSGKYLQVYAEFENHTFNERKDMALNLAPYSTQEIGWMEGWKFTSGETIKLFHSDYAPAFYTIP